MHKALSIPYYQRDSTNQSEFFSIKALCILAFTTNIESFITHLHHVVFHLLYIDEGTRQTAPFVCQ